MPAQRFVLHERFQAEEILESVKSHRVTMFSASREFISICSPSPISRIISGRSATASPPPRHAGGRGAPMDRRIRQIIYEGYGLTETSPFASYNHDSLYREGASARPKKSR